MQARIAPIAKPIAPFCGSLLGVGAVGSAVSVNWTPSLFFDRADSRPLSSDCIFASWLASILYGRVPACVDCICCVIFVSCSFSPLICSSRLLLFVETVTSW
ncbi:hypothetical protein amrb99_17250 [Actinomadura sp. RB99]|nr:hypothetical protein [Actinomadura sp. RB99]